MEAASSSSPTGVPEGDGGDGADGKGVRFTASAAGAGLRVLDAVRLLGPSLAKLCDMGGNSTNNTNNNNNNKDAGTTVASSLCASVHCVTVKNTARVLESLAVAVDNDPNDDNHRPPDARVAPVTADVFWAVCLLAHFASAYKTVTKRWALP